MIWEMTTTAPSGEESTVFLDHEPTVGELQAAVGGYFEVLPSKGEFYADEDGLYKKLPLNEKMSRKLGYSIVGNVVEVRRK